MCIAGDGIVFNIEFVESSLGTNPKVVVLVFYQCVDVVAVDAAVAVAVVIVSDVVAAIVAAVAATPVFLVVVTILNSHKSRKNILLSALNYKTESGTDTRTQRAS